MGLLAASYTAGKPGCSLTCFQFPLWEKIRGQEGLPWHWTMQLWRRSSMSKVKLPYLLQCIQTWFCFPLVQWGNFSTRLPDFHKGARTHEWFSKLVFFGGKTAENSCHSNFMLHRHIISYLTFLYPEFSFSLISKPIDFRDSNISVKIDRRS